ncbi:unnamed protein product [Cladocopium goreaui]|uniref:3'(2'),5'-bisphosphate nucleotidase 2 (3'(2'),5-bisphosphonucleoside 3'(2')-phosphohydrolase 2) (DPNPase 2) (Halotolerance protein HAL22) n=1 Tax=Cladocopium goreaui TaxID=2562237 RepID=A0A9P1BKH8_9DINO|nr:unnamed protein product [Cladocopium goreaui]
METDFAIAAAASLRLAHPVSGHRNFRNFRVPRQLSRRKWNLAGAGATTLAVSVAAGLGSPRKAPRQGARAGGAGRAARAFGGQLEEEVAAAAEVVQKALALVQALACDMDVAPPSLGKEIEACDVTAGISTIKPGDSTPVTAADFAIQGLVSRALKQRFPADRFMGEEDSKELREDEDLCNLALELCSNFGGSISREEFLQCVDAGLEADQGQQRVWVLDPIDGTKGFVTGQGYVIGLSLLADGVPLIGVMGNPNVQSTPPIMIAVKGQGLRWWPAAGSGPLDFKVVKPDWAEQDFTLPTDPTDPTDAAAPKEGVDFPPWLLSPQSTRDACRPFGPRADGSELCCGSMVKYFAVATGSHCGYVQYEKELKTWDHACGVICVAESGGAARVTDAEGQEVTFPGRKFRVAGGIVSCSRWCTPAMRAALMEACAGNL